MAVCDPRTDHHFKIVGRKLQRPCLLSLLVWHMSPNVHSSTSKDLPPSPVKSAAWVKQDLKHHFMLVLGQYQKK